jgi:16S rRNA (adenine1518-N6/adenine1519-N6)-dimethyltransferase
MSDVRALLRQYDLRPSKRLGQHFLVSEGTLSRIVAAAEVGPQDTVLEIGAGLGHLTRRLLDAAGEVVAVELDRRLVKVLQTELAGCDNLRLVQGDILALDPAVLVEERPYSVVANLPYAITSAVLRHLLEARLPPRRMVITIQREVAERIVARSGRMSLLAISVQFYGQPKLLFRIKPGAFLPPPKVESAVLRIDRHECPPVRPEDPELFFRVVRAGFSQPRKQLRNSLSAGLELPVDAVVATMHAVEIDPRRRAERLRLEEWDRLSAALARHLVL